MKVKGDAWKRGVEGGNNARWAIAVVWMLMLSSNMRSHQRSPVVGDIDASVGSGAFAGKFRMFGWIGDVGTVWGGCNNDRLKVESL